MEKVRFGSTKYRAGAVNPPVIKKIRDHKLNREEFDTVPIEEITD